ncbi:MAG TPA: phosphotransferase [Povalibacter sp.]|nr:phosphotransferase [Povalibacter sp.]
MADDRSTAQSRALPGGVSCEVVLERDASGREIVVKQPLARLKVAADWRSDPGRWNVEVAALRAMRELLDPGAVPRVLWEDPANHRFAMERIDPALRNWRDELNERRVDPATADRVGEWLGQLHRRSASRPDLAQAFASREYFMQLRIEPFFRRIAQRNPQIDPAVRTVIDAMLAPGRALIHGDFSPKNMLVRGSQVVVLDCETAHWGDPRFDVAFCLMHLTLDALHKPPSEPFVAAARTFLDAYVREAGDADLDALLVMTTGCLVLARLEGDSPIDFREQLDLAAVKQLALDWIERPADDPYGALDAAFAGAD